MSNEKKKCKLYSGTKWQGSNEINAKIIYRRIESAHHPFQKKKKEKCWNILSEQIPPKQNTLVFIFRKWNQPKKKSQTNSTSMQNVPSVTLSCDWLRSARVVTHSHSLSVQSGLWKSQLSLRWYWKAIPTVCTDKCANPRENRKRKTKGNLMDIQRPIMYNPTDNKVDISVQTLCIDSENIYCIIHPSPPSDTRISVKLYSPTMATRQPS